ncbi:MAG: hypothetical protein Q9218_000393 [Villophora microphyllina]
MSAERNLHVPSVQDSSTAQTTTPKDVLFATPNSGNGQTRAWEGTPSRVTINVRDAAVRAAPVGDPASVDKDHACCDSDKDELAHSSEPDTSRDPNPEPPGAVSPSASPSRSPEIEVADVEDINEEPGHTRWRTLSSVPDPIKLQNEIWAAFPFGDQAHHFWESADEIARQMQEEPIEDGLLFRQLSDWINLYLAMTEPYVSQWLDMYVDQQEFWNHFPDVMNALCLRCTQRSTAVLPLPFRHDNSRADIESFEDMFASFTALSFRMVDIDCQYLRTIGVDDKAKPDFVSLGYLEWLRSILSPAKSLLWRHLHVEYNYDASATIAAVIRRACGSSCNGLSSMSQMLHHSLHRARDIPDVVDKVGIILDTVVQMLDLCHLSHGESLGTENCVQSSRETLVTSAYALFQGGSTLLQTFITKQVAALSHDLCDAIVRHLSALLQRITAASEELTTRILKEDLEVQHNFPAADAPVIADKAWKFQVLRKCFLEGRMEIRIQGVESMQQDLVNIHRKFIMGKTDVHSVVPFLCDFIVDNRLIDYLVGVESHPRLIRSSGNIVGFLVVNRRYTEAESDRIWNTVSESQDSGVVGALMQMLPSIFNISEYPQLLYLVIKLNKVPLAAWDTRMITYAGSLLNHTARSWKEHRRGYAMDEPPYHCCFRLLREASGNASLTSTNRRALSLFASQMLESLLDVGPSDHDRLRLYQDCIDDIAKHTKFATGSICAINILLRHDTTTDIATLARDYRLSDLVIDEFEHMTGQMPQGLQDLRLFEEALMVRFDLLQHIILSSPGSIDPERGWNLWQAMIGAKAPSDQVRDSALVMLVNTTMALRNHNRFIDACINEYLPILSPRFFTGNILYFVNQISHYGVFLEQASNHATGVPADMLGIDILWRIALVAPPHTVERKAIETLVASYVDSPKARGAPKAAIERMQVEVVERCVRQLTTAASSLKVMGDNLSNEEDEPMITTTPEEILEQRLSFSRSLLILRELFNKIRIHPSYSPVPSARSQVNSDVEEINGCPVTIRYQPFSGASNRPMKLLQIGDLETAQDLAQRFATLTGFSRFMVIVGGQKVNLDECSNATLRATRLHEKGLFLIKNIHGNESGPDLTSARVLKPLEKEVMAHFSEFYRFLSLDEGLAQNVSPYAYGIQHPSIAHFPQVLEFLKAFPPDDQVISLVNSKDTSIEDIFPPFVGRDSLDWVIHGISDLIQWCIQFLKATKKPIQIDDNPMESLFRAYLFPQISEPSDCSPIASTIPVLHSKTRDNLYGIVLALSNSIPEYCKLLKLVRNLLPRSEGAQAWSWGIAQIAEDYSYDANWNFDRSNAIRASTGYPGLRNLTNTCYMNSLLTQLFMNLKFRGFILGTDIADGSHTQRLLAESRALFAFMQGTALKAVDTQGVADSLINYENTAIDVSVQMDVDEFYNLLFDRWENQILSDAGKRTFRAFYGGQLVQQIKSKECPHISERLESFSAIQCDIQGKTNLTESLAAYVGGEVMEGDNKACLKDIPDNLIFHLKRFDYDIMTGTRIKINDRFDFPERIDMSPYHVDFLCDTEQPLPPDNFELVGILVHTGTAESGHYYSYIKERLGRAEQNASWVEFNDADVTPFNPSQIPDACFGGVTESVGYTAGPYAKSWNAYMLFYQRIRAMDVDHQHKPLGRDLSLKDLPSFNPGNRIAIDNERFLRRYCMFDSTHARFVTSVLDRVRTVTGSCCSDDHAMEEDAILLTLEYCDQVLSRMKDPTDFERLVDALTTTIRVCAVCCKLALEWIASSPTAFRNLLLKCPTAKVRKSFAGLVVRALRYLRETDPPEYGLDVDSVELKSSNGVIAETSHGVLQRIVRNLRDIWPSLHSHARAWDDYFGLLADIAGLGVTEAFILLREDFLKSCLEVLIIESSGTKRLRVDNPHYNQLLRLLEKGRKYSLASLIELLQVLMTQIDLHAPAFDPTYRDRYQLDNGLLPLSNSEEIYLYYGPDLGRSRPLVFLDKIITANSNPAAVTKILRIMISAEPLVGQLGSISRTILNGVNIDPADLAEPHLRAALTFCETTSSAQSMRDMINQIAREVDTIGTSGGATHLGFFVKARQLENPRIPRRLINKQILKTVHLWGPPLLMYYEEAVRQATLNFLSDLIFHAGTQSVDSGDEITGLEGYARGLCEACIKRVQENVIHPNNAVEAKSVHIILRVIRHCVSTYFQTGTAEDEQIAEDAEGTWNLITCVEHRTQQKNSAGVWPSYDYRGRD